MLRRLAWPLLGLILLTGGLLGCQQAPSTPQQGATKPAATTAAPTAAAPAQASPQAAAKTDTSGAPKTAAAPTAAARTEPKGKVSYAFHTALSPAWLDPQENPALITPYVFQYAIHDALVKHLPGQPFAASLAESYEIAPDFKSATFKLRDGVKFHDGTPVTSEDAKFTFENYRGANSKILKEKTASVETPDARTINFTFTEPFLDFLVLYGSAASGAGWVVPKNYYQQVGPDGFKNNPIGAGPFKFVRQTAGQEIEFEAVADYWRKAPHAKTLVIRGVPEDSTRVAQLQAGEIDAMNLVPGQLLDTVRNDPNLRLAPVAGSSFWMEMTGWEKPDSSFHDKRVRQAVSLALDRQALSDAESGGLSQPLGNWIPPQWPAAIEAPVFPHDPARARQLLAEAGFPNGFEVSQLTPLPPYFSLAERIITQLREVGIRVNRLNQMERGAFSEAVTQGPEGLPGMVLNISGNPGDAAGRIRAFVVCNGSSSRTCVPEIDQKFQQYESSANPDERERLIAEIQQQVLDDYIFIPVYRLAFIGGLGPRVTNEWDQVFGAIPQYSHLGPYEDIQLRE